MIHPTTCARSGVRYACLAMVLMAVGGCGLLPKGQVDLDVSMKDRGVASWYGTDFHGRLAADGRPYDMYALTAAHRSLPLGTVLRVLNVSNGRTAVVRVTDRGPYAAGRMLDLSYASAQRLGFVKRGLAPVIIEVVGESRLLSQWNWEGAGSIHPAEDLPPQGPRDLHEREHGGEQGRGALPASDVWGPPRQRRVADVFAADHYVDCRATMLLTS